MTKMRRHNTLSKQEIDYFIESKATIEIIGINKNGTTEGGRLLKDNLDGTFDIEIQYPFGNCIGKAKQCDQWWCTFEYIPKEKII